MCSYLSLAAGVVSAVQAMVALGLSYAVSNCLFWSSITDVCDKRYMGQANGLVSGWAIHLLCTTYLYRD